MSEKSIDALREELLRDIKTAQDAGLNVGPDGVYIFDLAYKNRPVCLLGAVLFARGEPAVWSDLLGTIIILELIRIQPDAAARQELYKDLIDACIAPGGRLRPGAKAWRK